MKMATRVQQLSASKTSATGNLAASLASRGVPVANLAAGELDGDTSETVKQGAIQAIRAGRNRYTEAAGIPDLRQKIAERMATGIRVSLAIGDEELAGGLTRIV
jgi:aspartate aminotransferase